MRILAYNWRDLAHPLAGGAEVYLMSIAREWTNMGHEVTLFASAVAGRPARETVEDIEVVRRGGPIGVYREARRFWKSQCHGHYDLVVESINTRPFFCHKYIKGTPVVSVIHQVAKEVWKYETNPVVALMGRYILEPRWLYRYRDRPVVTVSLSSKVSLQEYGLKRVSVIPEGWNAPALETRPCKASVPTLVFVGRLSANKRPDHAIRALEILQDRLPQAQLWIIGDGPWRDRCERMGAPRVTLLGRVSESEKHARLASAHALISTSVREGWGLVVTEAAALGTPSVAYDVPGLRDSVPASGGVLTPPNPERLADALVYYLPRWLSDPPITSAGGVVPWSEVAREILRVGLEGGSLGRC